MRYALYFTPSDDDPLTRAAAAWLGRDAFTGDAVARPAPDGLDPEALARNTAEPRRYGFHATLVAPFRLRADADAAAPALAADAVGAAHAPFDIPRLALTRIGSFRALTPASPCAPLDALAAAAVDRFDAVRAPLGPAEIARRRPERLTPRQRAYLDRHGYPFVKDEFRFHMTLTGPVAPQEDARVTRALDVHFLPLLDRSVRVDALALFVEPEPGAPFHVHSLHRLGAIAARKSA